MVLRLYRLTFIDQQCGSWKSLCCSASDESDDPPSRTFNSSSWSDSSSAVVSSSRSNRSGADANSIDPPNATEDVQHPLTSSTTSRRQRRSYDPDSDSEGLTRLNRAVIAAAQALAPSRSHELCTILHRQNVDVRRRHREFLYRISQSKSRPAKARKQKCKVRQDTAKEGNDDQQQCVIHASDHDELGIVNLPADRRHGLAGDSNGIKQTTQSSTMSPTFGKPSWCWQSIQ